MQLSILFFFYKKNQRGNILKKIYLLILYKILINVYNVYVDEYVQSIINEIFCKN